MWTFITVALLLGTLLVGVGECQDSKTLKIGEIEWHLDYDIALSRKVRHPCRLALRLSNAPAFGKLKFEQRRYQSPESGDINSNHCANITWDFRSAAKVAPQLSITIKDYGVYSSCWLPT